MFSLNFGLHHNMLYVWPEVPLKLLSLQMSVVVATQFLHNLNKDETEVRFLTNARVPLPAIRHSQIEKQRELCSILSS